MVRSLIVSLVVCAAPGLARSEAAEPAEFHYSFTDQRQLEDWPGPPGHALVLLNTQWLNVRSDGDRVCRGTFHRTIRNELHLEFDAVYVRGRGAAIVLATKTDEVRCYASGKEWGYQARVLHSRRGKLLDQSRPVSGLLPTQKQHVQLDCAGRAIRFRVADQETRLELDRPLKDYHLAFEAEPGAQMVVKDLTLRARLAD